MVDKARMENIKKLAYGEQAGCQPFEGEVHIVRTVRELRIWNLASFLIEMIKECEGLTGDNKEIGEHYEKCRDRSSKELVELSRAYGEMEEELIELKCEHEKHKELQGEYKRLLAFAFGLTRERPKINPGEK